ncbi:benzoate/H(+) symporter BenE family transporter [Limnobacter sp.]|uniref:benzoate/H(+) symporter BenE family transporter n=1 Tax=Limnobacter sp. TaxID=2003368 RepID=UPI0025B99DEF|nr:benzoate/H(+) symporter BenE family transporter [Limnobacter sp.]
MNAQVLSRSDLSFTAIAAGFLAVLVSYTGPMTIYYQAWQSSDLPTEHFSSWLWAVSIAACLSGVYLSLRYRTPIITAWSAPGAALLIGLLPGISMGEVVGSYLVVAFALIGIGISGVFDKLLGAIPKSIACGMMAGILIQFGLKAFTAIESNPTLALSLIVGFLVLKALLPRYALVLLFIAGVLLAKVMGLTHLDQIHFEWTTPVFYSPEFSLSSLLSFGIPLLLTSLTGQFLPGMAILRKDGYSVSADPILKITGLLSIFVAFVGGITTVIAAITAALCTGKDAHPDAQKRYVAGVVNGLFYGIGAAMAGSVAMLFTALPGALIAVIAGLGLLGAIASNTEGIFQSKEGSEAGVITLLVTASGLSFLSIGSAFWGVALGLLSYHLLKNPLRLNN